MSGEQTAAQAATQEAATHAAGEADAGRMPAIYLSHGAPPLADDALWTRQLADWAASLPRPASVLVFPLLFGTGMGIQDHGAGCGRTRTSGQERLRDCRV